MNTYSLESEKIDYLEEDIVKTRQIFRVGPGEFDLIGINKITKNSQKSIATLVMIPGSNSDFDTSFDKMSICLAKKKIDIWGIDFRYSFVPNNINTSPYCIVTGCNFMQNWNTDLHLSDLDIVVKMAEQSSPDNKVFITGWSQGAYLAYRYSITKPNLKGIIPIDVIYNLDLTLTDIVDKTRAEIAVRNSKINSGIFYEDVLTIKYIAYQALTNPDGLSVVIPGLTNKQAALFALTQTYRLGVNPIPNYRFNQGDLVSLRHTDLDFALQQGLKLNSFQSILVLTELRNQWLDSNIPNITVPVLYIGAEFGFGTYGLYTPNAIRTFNPNVETLIVPDYGHADLVYSNTAKDDVWINIYKWIKKYS